jgi:hypothetical protein
MPPHPFRGRAPQPTPDVHHQERGIVGVHAEVRGAPAGDRRAETVAIAEVTCLPVFGPISAGKFLGYDLLQFAILFLELTSRFISDGRAD